MLNPMRTRSSVRIGCFVLGSLCSLTSTLPLAGQSLQPAAVRVGDRVRVASVHLPAERLARVVALGADSLTLKYARNFGEGRVAWRSVQLLAVSEGRRSRSQGARVGARRGFLLGLIPGGIIALVGVIGSSSDFACIGCGTVVFVIPAALIVTGTATGAAFGAAFPGERWRTVVPSPR